MNFSTLLPFLKPLNSFLAREQIRFIRDEVVANTAVRDETVESIPIKCASIVWEIGAKGKSCMRSCFYNSIKVKEGEVTIGEACRKCGICTCVCPIPGAIFLTGRP